MRLHTPRQLRLMLSASLLFDPTLLRGNDSRFLKSIYHLPLFHLLRIPIGVV